MARWLTLPPNAATARAVVFCFPFAGGGASFYRAWASLVPPSIALCPVQPPGREDRLMERPFDRMQPLVAAAVEEILPHLPPRYALFGHSMGAMMAYEIAQALRERGAKPPAHLFVSGAPAPHRAHEIVPIYDLPEEEFIAALQRFGGTPDEVLRNRELFELLAPRLRADLAVTGTYVWTHRPPLACPITAFGGEHDPSVAPDAIEAWGEHTVGAFDAMIFPGEHFFVAAAARQITARVRDALA
jgi:medium-chain acyl-[acyl-carrier-protein] hydrolase